MIELISKSRTPLRLKDISTGLSIPRTTALRIVQTLLDRNFLASKEDGTLTLGTALVQVGVIALDNLDIRSFARPVLRKLSGETGESAHIAMLNGNKSLLVEVCDSPRPVRIAARPGTLVDLHCSATGKVFLAFGIPEPQAFCKTLPLTAHTPNTNSTVKAVLASIKQTRKQGYALDEEEYVLGARCIAVPVINAFGKTIAAVGLTASTATLTKEKIPALTKKLKASAADISASMGFGH